MKFKKILVTTLFLFMPLVVFFITLRALIYADTEVEPYSVIILAGQSWAEGTNSFRSVLPTGNGIDKKNYSPADESTKFWWAGADGKGPANTFEFLNMFYSGQSVAGWQQSGGPTATGAARMESLKTDTQRAGLFGPELGIGRELYDKGRRKVIVLKVSYGFQSLAKSNSPFVPYDFNTEAGRNKSYQRMKTEFKALTTYLHDNNMTYTVDGLYWIQGGTDALQDSYASQYQTNFTNFVNFAKTDFQLQPTAHIVAAKMSLMQCLNNSYPTTIYNYCGFPYAQAVDPLTFADLTVGHANFARRLTQVRGALQTVADNDPKVDVVEMNDIPISNDYIHDSEQGNIIFGRRFANMYKLPYRLEGSNDYDGDGIPNNLEDTGRGAQCPLTYDAAYNANNNTNPANNGNLGDDDSDCDGYPNYLDRINGPGSGLSQ